MNDLQGAIQKILDDRVAAGTEQGVQVAAYYKGRCILNAWAGTADESGRPVEADTLFPVFSTTKGIGAAVIHLLAERGKLDYEDKVCDYWPAFAAHGKEGIAVRHVLCHTAGLVDIPAGLTAEQVNDEAAMARVMEGLTPQWEPGTAFDYHAMTFGWLVAELARRADGRPFAQILREELCAPLGIEDLYVGIPDEAEPRVAALREPGAIAPVFAPGAMAPIPAGASPLCPWMNSPGARRTCLPASTGIMTAEAAARLYAGLLPGGVDGVELLPLSRMERALVPATLSNGEEIPHRAQGFTRREEAMGDGLRTFGHGGYGGSLAFGDLDKGLAFCFARNLFVPENGGLTGVLAETVLDYVDNLR